MLTHSPVDIHDAPDPPPPVLPYATPPREHRLRNVLVGLTIVAVVLGVYWAFTWDYWKIVIRGKHPIVFEQARRYLAYGWAALLAIVAAVPLTNRLLWRAIARLRRVTPRGRRWTTVG